MDISSVEEFVADIKTVKAASYPDEAARRLKILEIVGNFIRKVDIGGLLTATANISDEDHLTSLAQALSYLFDANALEQVLTKEEVLKLITTGIDNPNFDIRQISLNKLLQEGVDFADEGSFLKELLPGLLHSLCDPEVNISKKASGYLFQYFTKEVSNKVEVLREMFELCSEVYSIVCGGASEKLQNMSKSDASTYLLRISHLLCCISSTPNNENAIPKAVEFLSSVLNGNDLLLQLNVINLIPLVASTRIGLETCLESNLDEIMFKFEASPLLREYSLRVLSYVAARSLHFGSQHLATKFIEVLNNALLITQPQQTTEACNLLHVFGCFIGSSNSKSLEILKDDTMKHWAKLATTGNEQVLVSAFKSLSDAINAGAYNYSKTNAFLSLFPSTDEEANFGWSPFKTEDVTHDNDYEASKDISSEDLVLVSNGSKILVQEFYSAFKKYRMPRMRMKSPASNLVDVCFHYLNLPIDELHCACFMFLRTLVAQASPWGIQLVFSRDDYIKALLDRSLKFSKVAKEWRFGVIEAAVHHPLETLPIDVTEQLSAFLKDGPFIGPRSGTARVLNAEPSVIVETI